MRFGGVVELGAVLIHADVSGHEVASSASSTTLAFTMAVDEEYSQYSRDRVRRKTSFLGGVESNLNLSLKPSS